MRHHGYAGKLGYSSAGAIAHFIVVDMVAAAASGDKTPKQAAERAAVRAQRYYKLYGYPVSQKLKRHLVESS